MSDKPKITFVPMDIWNEPQPPLEWSAKLIVLNKSDVKLPDMPEVKPEVIEGFDFHGEDDQ